MVRKGQKSPRAKGSGARRPTHKRVKRSARAERDRIQRLEAELRRVSEALRQEREKNRKRSALKKRKKTESARRGSPLPKRRAEPPVAVPASHSKHRPAKRKAKGPSRYRDERGRFISEREKKKIEAIKRIERKHAPELLREEAERRRLYPIGTFVFRNLNRLVRNVSNAMEDSNFDLSVDALSHAYGSMFDAKVEVNGLRDIDLSDMKARIEKEDIILQAAMAALAELGKSRMKKGLQVQIQLRPEETLMLLYGRDKPLMTTSWMSLDEPQEAGALVTRARRMLDQLANNGWDVKKIILSFNYDREVALACR